MPLLLFQFFVFKSIAYEAALSFKKCPARKRIYRNRVLISIRIVSFFMLLLVARYAYLQIRVTKRFQPPADQNRIRLQPLAPSRGYL